MQVRDTLSNKRSTTVHTMRGHFDRIFSAIPEHTRNAISMKTFEDHPEAKYWVCGNDEEQAKGKGWAGIDYPRVTTLQGSTKSASSYSRQNGLST